MDLFDPYAASAGHELDAWIHCQVLENPRPIHIPPYSTDDAEADRLKKSMEKRFRVRIIVGRTGVRGKPWFARYELTPGNPTEVLAETLALAICRLSALAAERLPRAD